jgi:hypothetical protein
MAPKDCEHKPGPGQIPACTAPYASNSTCSPRRSAAVETAIERAADAGTEAADSDLRARPAAAPPGGRPDRRGHDVLAALTVGSIVAAHTRVEHVTVAAYQIVTDAVAAEPGRA